MKNQLPTYYIGHLTEDIPPGEDPIGARGVLGGMVSYGIVADARTRPSWLPRPTLVTKVGWDEPAFQDLLRLATAEHFNVHNIAADSLRRGIPKYQNKYDMNGRTQKRYGGSPAFDEYDIPHIGQIVGPDGGNCILGTVSGWGEMTEGFMLGMEYLKGPNGFLAAAPQGWHRHVDPENNIVHRPVPEIFRKNMFGGLGLCVVSDEDLCINVDEKGKPIIDRDYMNDIVQKVGTFIMTHGPNGATVLKDKVETHFPSFILTPREIELQNPTGLGDTFTAIVTRGITQGLRMADAVGIAHLTTAAKLAEGPGTIQNRGEGMQSLLTTSQLQQFLLNDNKTWNPNDREFQSRRDRVLRFADRYNQDYGADLGHVLREDYGIDLEGARVGVESCSNFAFRR